MHAVHLLEFWNHFVSEFLLNLAEMSEMFLNVNSKKIQHKYCHNKICPCSILRLLQTISNETLL